MAEPNDGGPAFPCEIDQRDEGYGGMSLRDWFARRGIGVVPWFIPISDAQCEQMSVNCYKLADAMLAERQKRQEPTDGQNQDQTETV